MSSIVILMRHGKAERGLDDVPDREYRLTEEGERSLAATLPKGLSLVPDGATLQVWSSPAVRAEQTAGIMLRACKRAGLNVDPELLLVDSLWDQDVDTFLCEATACAADIVVAVGHNPFVEELTEQLTGSRIDILTGGFAAIKLSGEIAVEEALPEIEERETTGNLPPEGADGGNLPPEAMDGGNLTSEKAADDEGLPPSDAPEGGHGPEEAELVTVIDISDLEGRLLWFWQGPESQLWKPLVFMESVLGSSADAVQTRLDAFLASPEDIETMHKFRVSIRTLRSLLAFVSPWQNPKQNKAAQADLKSIVAVTSRLRELDVLASEASAMAGVSPVSVGHLQDAAAHERAYVISRLTSKRVARQMKSALRELHSVKWRKDIEASGLAPDAIRKHFDGLADDLRGRLDALDIADAEATHDVRKAAKRVRYDAEQFKAFIGDDAAAIAKGMTAHQDDLGAVCDARVNIDLINELFDDGLPSPVAWDLALLRARSETFLYTTLRRAASLGNSG